MIQFVLHRLISRFSLSSRPRLASSAHHEPSATASLAFPVFVQGLALSLGLIVAIGAQNAFVLRQGLRREHVGSVVLFCALADACSSPRACWAWRRPWGRARAWRARWRWRARLSWRSTAGRRCAARQVHRTGCRRPRAVRACRGRGPGAGGRLHAAQPACLPGHRAAGRQHRRAAAGRAAGLVHRRGQQGQPGLVRALLGFGRAGWRRGLPGRGPGRCSTA
jgi:hypothetical protein